MSDEDAQKAIDELTGADLGGRSITVNEARPAPARRRRVVAGGGDRGGRAATATDPLRQARQIGLVMAPVSAPCTSRAYLPSTPLV